MLRTFVTFFASRPIMTVAAWVAAVGFGVVAYTSLLPREGFPSVDLPIAVVSGSYLVDDAEQVDAQITRPLGTTIGEVAGVAAVESFANDTSFTMVIRFEPHVASAEGVEAVQAAATTVELPETARYQVSPVDGSKFLGQYDLLIGIYGGPEASPGDLQDAAALAAPVLADVDGVAGAEVIAQRVEGTDPSSGATITRQTDFNLFTREQEGAMELRPSISVGLTAEPGVDALAIRDAADRGIARLAGNGTLPEGYEAVVALDFATQIRQQIGSLESNVLSGVIAVALIALLLISWRASLVTALFVVTVLATTVGALHLIGISLNTISLFGVILALGLFVDDAIVITESIVAGKRQGGDQLSIIRSAIGRVGTASISGTVTTILVFAPMLTISGILGRFIRILPLTVMVALGISLLLSFVFIPVACRFLVIPAKRDDGLLTSLESRLAAAVASLPSARGWRGAIRASLAVGLSVAMTIIGLLVLAPRVGFNIFPPQKDSTAIVVEATFPPGTELAEAQRIALDINQQAVTALGEHVVRAYTYRGNASRTTTEIQLTGIGDRPTAPQLVAERLDPVTSGLSGARVTARPVSVGPPEATFPFLVQIHDDDPEVLEAAAGIVAADLARATITRPNGTTFTVVETETAYGDSVARFNSRRLIEVRARFDADDVTTTTSSTRTYLEERYGPKELAALGLEPDALGFDFGFESDNQESFASLPYAFLVALGSMLLLLVLQFRSVAQWLLVFLAIPFSFFGVFGGLLLTGNVISFFVMLGLIGLIGIAVNNTILLVDYANQERRAGLDRRRAIEHALRQRFRPLIATSLTTVAGLAPLALSDPFWEALGMTIIFGLLSSTLLVLLSFPFYYLGVEAMRDRIVTPWRRRGSTTDEVDQRAETEQAPLPLG